MRYMVAFIVAGFITLATPAAHAGVNPLPTNPGTICPVARVMVGYHMTPDCRVVKNRRHHHR